MTDRELLEKLEIILEHVADVYALDPLLTGPVKMIQKHFRDQAEANQRVIPWCRRNGNRPEDHEIVIATDPHVCWSCGEEIE